MSPLRRPTTAASVLLALLDEAFDHASWHGTTLLGSIRGMPVATALWRPSPGRHNIWEIVVHAAYWKYTVHRRLANQKRGSFPLEGSNWFRRPQGAPDRRAWRSDIGLLVEQHEQLRETVANLSARDLARPLAKRDAAYLIRGIAAHDLYHAGQIQLLKRLHGS